MLVIDHTLSQRLERAEGAACAGFAEARARCSPEHGSEWIEVAGAYVVFDGVLSPVTQTFGLGLFDPVTPADMARIEKFFRDRGAPVQHEISPLAGIPFVDSLVQRGYRPIEFSSVMFRELNGETPPPDPDRGIAVRVAGNEDRELWARTAASGWSGTAGIDEDLFALLSIAESRADSVSFLAERNGEAIAAATLCIEGDVAVFAGASTMPHARRLGAQRALLDARFQYAAHAGCNLAMMCAEPGSASQRNAERHGFRIAYSRTKWRLWDML